jgi:hypothetical protein
MRNTILKSLVVLFIFMSVAVTRFAVAQEPPAERPPADVVGKWTIYAKDPNGSTSTKYFELTQKGNTIGGHFKGPNASGGVEGTINEQHIVVKTKTRRPLVFRGRVEGNTIVGTFHAREGTGEFQAYRQE